VSILDELLSRPEKEIIHLPAQFLISEKDERKKKEDKADKQPKHPVRQTISGGCIRCLLGYYVCKKLNHLSQPGVPNILVISPWFVNPHKKWCQVHFYRGEENWCQVHFLITP
jgi:hypothetical protein